MPAPKNFRPHPKRPNTLKLQWHITHRCNWRCKHCYHDTYEGSELTLAEQKKAFHQFLALAKAEGRLPMMTITGGEPFIRTDFLELLKYISKYKGEIGEFVILTNGSYLTDEMLKKLRKEVPVIDGFSISLEGTEEVNDHIRGKGTFQQIFDAAMRVKKHGFNVGLSTTISKLNYLDIFNIVDQLIIYDIPLMIKRFVPIGGGKRMRDLMLEPHELRDLYHRSRAIKNKHMLPNEIPLVRPRELYLIRRDNICTGGLQYLDWPDRRHQTCAVRHKSLIVIMPDGEVYPCRLLPISLGNLQEQSLEEMYHGEGYNQFTHPEKQDQTCKTCPVYDKCQGGAPCISHAITEDFYARDPQCWRPIT